jgi:hypothetical protein
MTSLDEFRFKISALNKSSAPYEKDTKHGDNSNPFLDKYKKYIICAVVIFLLLVLFKPGFIQGKTEEGKKNNKIVFSSLIKYWIIFSLIIFVSIYVYCNVICKKNKNDSSSCKRCGK